MNNTPQSTAMLQGLQNEDSIAEAFINKMDTVEGKKGVTITKCGLFVSKTHGFLGASPDGIITADPEETTPGVAEFKYIQVTPDETDVLLRQHICSKVQHNNAETIQLHKNHKYYFQLYQQMFVTGYHWGVFIAQGTEGGLFYEKVTFTEAFWSPILNKMENFFDKFFVYELAYPRIQLGLERFHY